MPQTLRQRAGHPIVLSVSTIATLGLCCLMVFGQVRAVRQMKDEALPAMAALPRLTARLGALEEQVELMELQRVLSAGGQDEVIRAYMLPEGPDLDRLLQLLDAVTGHLRGEGLVRDVSPITVGAAVDEGGVRFLPVEMEVTATEEGKDMLLDVIRLSGFLTVSDALSPQDIAMLLKLSENENPAGIAALEQHFLSVDLLRYAREATTLENRLVASFPSQAFLESFQAVKGSALLSDARRLLGGPLGDALERDHLWPMRLLDAQEASARYLKNGDVTLRLRLRAYVR